MRHLAIILIFFLASCSAVKKKQPDKIVKLDGDYIAGCIHGAVIVIKSLELDPDFDAIQGKCLMMYQHYQDAKQAKQV